jgi:pyruvate dehydrogenase complex dehydrogenase (E1) component
MNKDKWTQEDVISILANPMYTGIGVDKPTLTEEEWIKAFIKLMQEIGQEKALSIMLKVLKHTLKQTFNIPIIEFP